MLVALVRQKNVPSYVNFCTRRFRRVYLPLAPIEYLPLGLQG